MREEEVVQTERQGVTVSLRNPVAHRLELPLRARAAQPQRAAAPGRVPDDEAAALLVVEDEQGKMAGEDRAELLLGEGELAGGQDYRAHRGDERAEVPPVGDQEGRPL